MLNKVALRPRQPRTYLNPSIGSLKI